MTIEDQIKDEKLQYDINREAAKISALSSRKLDKYEYLTSEVILPSNQQQIIEQVFLKEIKEGRISIREAKNIQKEFNKQLNFMRRGNKNQEQRQVLNNINNLYNARDMAIQFIEDYGSMILGAKRLARQEGTGLKILTPNQMLKRLPIALAQIKAGNNSESLLNEIRQIVYSLYRSKEITKKVYNNIINSIKV